jgi:hypothetical protein
MHTTKIFLMAALALMTAACSNDDNDIQTPAEQPAKSEGIPFTATISLGESASTRALTENGTTIEATWATGEKVALIYKVSATTYLKEAEVTPQGDGTATISTTLDGSPVDDTDVTIVYPASAVDESTKDVKTNLLASQNGLLTGTGSIAEKYELRKTTTPAKLKIDGTTASLKGTVALTNLNAIFKFTLQDLSAAAKSATEFKVSANSGYVITTVTPGSASDVLYVALPAMGDGTYWFNATIDNKPYIAKATMAAATVAGKYYQTTVKMATIGDVILSDGKFAARSSTGTKVAMIAYLGSETDHATYKHGLALALSDATMMNWTDATGASGAAAYTPAAPTPMTSSWMLPSKDQWDKMIDACKNVLGTQNNYKDLRDGFSGISDASNLLSVYYWSGSEFDSSYAWYYNFENGYWNYDYKFADAYMVRACLAF